MTQATAPASLPLTVVAQSPELQAKLITALEHHAPENIHVPEDLAIARQRLPELAFLSDAALYGLIDDWSSDYRWLSWDDCLYRSNECFGYYMLTYTVNGWRYCGEYRFGHPYREAPLTEPGKKFLQAYLASHPEARR